jgi:hypothetical protein
VLSAAPAPAPQVAAAAPRPVQTPSVLPVAGQYGENLPRLAALAGLALVASGLGLRLRERLLGGRNSQPVTVEDLESDISDTDLHEGM